MRQNFLSHYGQSAFGATFVLYLVIFSSALVRLSSQEPTEVHATMLDQTFQFSETNITLLNEIQILSDGRIAYGGAGRFETVGVAAADGYVVNDHSSGGLLTNAFSITIDPIDRATYSLGSPWLNEFAYGLQKSTFASDDVNWSVNAPVRGPGHKILQLPNRSLLLGGRFQIAGSTNTYGLVKLDLAGNIFPGSFYDGTEGWEVTDFATLANGWILAAVQQTNSENGLVYGGYHAVQDNGVVGGLPFLLPDSHISAMARLPGTNVVLLAREDKNEGSEETEFFWVNENGITSGPAAEWPKVNGTVHAIAFETFTHETAINGGYDRVIIAGEFTRVGTNDCNNLASLNKDGSVAWCFPTNAGPDGAIRDVEVQSDGKVLIAGSFTNVSGVEANGMARIYGSSIEAGSYVFWGDSDYTASEKAGELFLRLNRRGGLTTALRVNLTPEFFPALVTTPLEVMFGPGEEAVLVRVGITDNFQATGRRIMQITASTTDSNVIITRPSTTISILDDETPGTFDPAFRPAVPDFQYAFAIQPDGKIIFGGYNNRLTRFNPDGSVDPTFVTNAVPSAGGYADLIQQILPQADGKIYIAGFFATTNSPYGINNVARLNSDGTLDRSFDPMLSRISGSPRGTKLQVFSSGEVLIWLPFGVNQAPSVPTGGLLRLQTNGYPKQAFPTVSKWANEPLLEVTPSDDVFTYGATVPRQIRKYSALGVASTNFATTDVTGRLFTMQAVSDGLFVGGNFTHVGTTTVRNLAKLDVETGAVQTNFAPSVNGTVTTIKTHGGKIYVSGDFTEVNGQTRYRIARLNSDGSLDATFNPGFGPNRPAGTIEVQVDRSVMIGGSFDRVDGVQAPQFAKLFGDVNSGEIKFVSHRIETSGTNQFVTLEIERVGGSWGQVSANIYTVEGSALEGTHFAKTNLTVTYLDGELGRRTIHIPLALAQGTDRPLTFSVVAAGFLKFEEATILIPQTASQLAASVTASGSTNVFRDIAVDPSGWIYAVGSFTNVGGVDITNIVRLSSSLSVDETFRPTDLPARVAGGVTNYFTPLNTVAENEEGIAIGGLFTSVGTNNWASVVRIRTDGTFDRGFNSAARVAVGNATLETRQLLYQPDGRLVLSLLGTPSKRLDLDGTSDTSFFGDFRNGGDVWLDSVGRFLVCSTVPAGVARFNTNGFSDTFFPVSYQLVGSTPPSVILNTLSIQPDDKILIGGAFTHVGSGITRPSPRLVRVLTNRVVDTNFGAVVGTNTPGSAPKNRVTAIQTLPTGDILIGGVFDIVNTQRRTMLALLSTNGELRNDFKVEVVGEQIDQFALLPDGDVVVRGKVSTVDGIEVGNLFKLSLPKSQPPVAKFLWPTNGAEVRVTDTQNIIEVHAFDPDGFIEQAVLELNGQAIATNNSGNIPFQAFLPSASGEHQLRLIVTDNSGLTTSETVFFSTVNIGFPGLLTIGTENGEIIIQYGQGRLFESADLQTWSEVDRDDGRYRTVPSEAQRYYRSSP